MQLDLSDVDPDETCKEAVDVDRVLEGLLNGQDSREPLFDIPPGSVPFARYKYPTDPQDIGEWQISVGDDSDFIRVREFGETSDAAGYGREVAWSICHAGIAILQLINRVRELEAENKRLAIDPADRMTVLEEQVAEWHDKRYGPVNTGPTVRKLGEEYGEFMEALLSGDLHRIEEEAADVALVLTHIVRGESGGSLSACMARTFDRVLSRQPAADPHRPAPAH